MTDIISVNGKQGQTVKRETSLAQLDSSNAQKAVRDAEANLESSQISLDKLNQPADALSILQAQNSLTQAQETKRQAQDDMGKGYADDSLKWALINQGHSRTTVEKAMETISEREAVEKENYAAIYGIPNFHLPAHYDLIVDTSFMSVKDVVGAIMSFVKQK